VKHQTTSYGKWILAGEHAVLRGHPALVFPLDTKKITFTYDLGATTPFQVLFKGDHGHELELILHGVIEKALTRVERTHVDLKGSLEVESSLPLGAGMGGSAALCVGIAQYFAAKKWILSSLVYEFARDLEDLFHGESSGVDIAVSLEGRAIQFQRDLAKGKSSAVREPLQLKWKPTWFLSYCGKKGVTSECVKRVRDLIEKSPERARKIDHQMHEAVSLAKTALTFEKSEDSLNQLAQALDSARDCFQQWGLCGGELSKHMDFLTENGALSVKPTGSGGGGYVLSLWSQPPPPALVSSLLPV